MWLQDLRQNLVAALDRTGTTSRDVWKSYWAAQQRFFKLMCVSFKVSYHVIAEVRTHMALSVKLQAKKGGLVGLRHSTSHSSSSAPVQQVWAAMYNLYSIGACWWVRL